MSTGSGYCSRTDIHKGCEKQRQCSRIRYHIGPCEGWQLSKKGTRMQRLCAACTTYHLEHNKPKDAARSALKRADTLAASHRNPSLRGLTRHDDPKLDLIGALCLLRPDVAPLFAQGSKALINIFQWTGAHKTGWGAPEAVLGACEQQESLSALINPTSPPLRVCGGEGSLRKIRPSDIFFEGSDAYIIRLVISPLLCDITKIEKFMHTVISLGDVVGFKTWVKDGGSPAQQQRFIYGVSILVIPDPAELGLVVNEKYREAHALELASFGGREGRVVLPDAPPAAFVETLRCDASDAIVLGCPRFEVKRGLISAEEAAEAGVGGSQSQGASQGASQEEDDVSVVSWNRTFGEWTYFSGKTASTGGLSAKQIKAMGGEGHFCTRPPTAKKPMDLLVVWSASNWRKGPKYAYAIKNDIPIITFEQLKEVLDKSEAEAEEEAEEEVEKKEKVEQEEEEEGEEKEKEEEGGLWIQTLCSQLQANRVHRHRHKRRRG